jgi:hypothetical protein
MTRRRQQLRFGCMWYCVGLQMRMGGSRTYPVKNRLPILAPEKSKVDEGRRRLIISYATTFRIDRISSFFAVDMFVHRSCSASTICSHSCLAEARSLGRRWLKNALIAAFGLSLLPGSSGMRRTRRPASHQRKTNPRYEATVLRTSPIPDSGQ